MTNDDLKAMLQSIMKQCFEDLRPISDGIDARYAFACGCITGICREALAAVAEDRQMHFPVHIIESNIP